MLAEQYDSALFDLDGVVYLGPHAIPGVPEALHALREHGIRVGFVTNNAARTPATVAQHLNDLGMQAAEEDVVNSTMATVHMLADELRPGDRVLPVGTEALAEQLRGAGYEVVDSHRDGPVAVVQGYSPTMEWSLLESGALAVQEGAKWFATNPDLTRPTDVGIVPGCGAQIQVIGVCVRAQPQIAGKPFPPLLEETVRRLGAKRPIFAGDRLDTDILGANNVQMDSLFVFTGAHGKLDLRDADEAHRPTAIGYDVSALLEPRREAVVEGTDARCRQQLVHNVDGRAQLQTSPQGREAQLDALWAALQLRWRQDANIDAILDALDEVQ